MSESEMVLGVDIGGTKIAAGLVDPVSGALHERTTLKVRHSCRDLIHDLNRIITNLSMCADQKGWFLSRIGIGIAEIVTPDGEVSSRQTFDLAGERLQDCLDTDLPVTVVSDVHCAALAESRFGHGRGQDLFFYISVGTGLSSSFVVGGKPVKGEHGSALVLGTGELPLEPRPGSARHFCLERFASGKGIADRYAAETGSSVSGAADVICKVREGDDVAKRVVTEAGYALGVALATVINVLDPGLVVLGGGLGSAEGIYASWAKETARSYIWHEPARNTPIMRSALGPDSGLIGAGFYAGLC
jgi:glucokinase